MSKLEIQAVYCIENMEKHMTLEQLVKLCVSDPDSSDLLEMQIKAYL